MFPMGVQSRPRNPQRPRVTTPVSSWLSWTPAALNPDFWIDASDTSTITASSGKVSQWNDKSGYARNVTQATGANQPLTGTYTLNGLNVVEFLNPAWMQHTGFTLAGRLWYLYVVVSNSNKETPYVTGQNSNQATVVTYNSPNPYYWNQFRDSSPGYFSTTDSAAASTPYILTADFNGASSSVRVNGSRVMSGTVGTANFVGIRLGMLNNTYLQGRIAEVVIGRGFLTNHQIAAWETYANTKWAVY